MITQDIKIFRWLVFPLENYFDSLKTCELSHSYNTTVVGFYKICKLQVKSSQNVFFSSWVDTYNNAPNLAIY